MTTTFLSFVFALLSVEIHANFMHQQLETNYTTIQSLDYLHLLSIYSSNQQPAPLFQLQSDFDIQISSRFNLNYSWIILQFIVCFVLMGFLITVCIIKLPGNDKNKEIRCDSKRQRQVVESAIKAFEQKASNEPILGHLADDATDLLNIFKENIGAVYQYKNELKCDLFTFNEFSNKICKIKLYDGNKIAVTLHIFPENFTENLEFHNHSKHMLLQNLCGQYIHTTWRINTAKNGKLYKFPYDRNGENKMQEIKGDLEYVDISNYKVGNWRCLHPSTIHTVSAAKNTQRIISFVIKSKLDQNKDRFVLSKRATLQRPTLNRLNITEEEKDNVLKYIIDSAC